MKMMKRCFAILLAVCLMFGMLPVYASAENATGTGQSGTIVAAQEIPGMSRLENGTGDVDSGRSTQYEPDEIVTVIVQMEEPAVMEYYGMSTYALDNDTSAGEAVSEFLTSEDAQALSEELLEGQQEVLTAILAAQPATMSLDETVDETTSDNVGVVAQWTRLVNAMAVNVPYYQLAVIKEMDGVRNAYVQHVYELPEDQLNMEDAGNAYYSYNMAGVGAAWSEGYTGEGMLIAVLDTGLDLEWASYWDDEAGGNVTGVRRVHEAFTEDSFKTESGKMNVRYTENSMERFLETTQLNANTGTDGGILIWDENALYKNRKIPFAADYADGDLNVRCAEEEHGTHVAGTVAGYAEDAEGQIKFSGVAPDAQLLIMKVFSDETGGAPEYAIVSALEDAAVLGADVMNLSLGSDNGYAHDDTMANEIYGRLNDAGILFMISAGNSDVSSYMNNYGGTNLSSDPDTSMISSPSVYDSALSVASINNSVESLTVLTWTGTDGQTHKIPYLDATGVAMKAKFSGVEELAVNIIPVDGAGTYSDYYNAGFRSYYGYGEKGLEGIALVKRGGTNESGEPMTFAEKINNASKFSWSYYDSSKGYYVTEYPIKAVLIYDNDPSASTLIYMSADNAMLTNAFIGGKDGAELAAAAQDAIAAGTYVTLSEVPMEDEITEWDQAGEMSEFTSWGAGPGLELKPEITAPGGNIWSSLMDQGYKGGSGTYDDYVGTYGMMSGTSMAAPHMTGITALVMQYVKDKEGLNQKGRENISLLTERLLVSTAVPQKDTSGVYYSPRRQGAGLVSVSGALSTPAYITVDGQDIGKLEFKDDPDKNGSYDFNFTVNNLTNNTLTYSAKAVLMRPDTSTGDTEWGTTRSFVENSDVVLKEVDLGSVTVSGKGSTQVSKNVTLTAEEKAQLDQLFPNGAFVEGFVILTAENGTDPQIGLPFMGFYGDWTAAPIFDSATWLDEVEEGLDYWEQETTWGVTEVAWYDGYSYTTLGTNPFAQSYGIAQEKYLEENITLAPDGFFRAINDFVLYQKRGAKIMVVEVKDAATGELYYHDYAYYMGKTVYDSSYGMAIPDSVFAFTETYWSGTDLDGNQLPSGTECIYTITAYGEGDYPLTESGIDGYLITDFDAVVPGTDTEPTFNGHAMDMTGDTISFKVLVDSEAPELVNNAVSVEKREDDIILSGTFQDAGSIASVEVYPQVKRTYQPGYGDPEYYEYGVDWVNPFYSEMVFDADCHEWKFEADVSEYAHINESFAGENYYYNYEWTGNVFIYGGDFGGNDRAYAVTVTENKTRDGLILSTTSALLQVGDEFELSVIDNTGSEEPIVRTSSKPEVATVDEFGKIVAVAPGQTEITVSNGEYSAVCVVAVEENDAQIESFDLAISSFEGLKPGGQLTVDVVNVQPANAVIQNISWEVKEDDAFIEAVGLENYVNYFPYGLLQIGKNTSDGLSGSLYLYNSASQFDIPGGHGVLTVTLDGVVRTMDISWEALYSYGVQDDLVPNTYYGEQAYYVTQGESVTLSAKYKESNLHSTSDVIADLTNLRLEGPDFFYVGSSEGYKAKLVAEEGYTLPESVKVYYVYDYGYEYELYYYQYSYNAETGDLQINCPYGATNKIRIVAAGVPVADTGDGVSDSDAETNGVSGGDAQTQNVSGGDTQTQNVSGGDAQTQSVSGGDAVSQSVSGGDAVSYSVSGGDAVVYTVRGEDAETNSASGSDAASYSSDSSNEAQTNTVAAAPVQTLSETYTRPDALYGPFDWEIVEGNGTMETVEVSDYYNTYEAVKYTPAESGISIIRATTKDGQYSLDFIVVCEPVLADTLNLDTHNVVLKEGETLQLNAEISPVPSLEKDEALTWKSFAPEVAEISEDGVITAVAEGYAYIQVYTTSNNTVSSYCRVQVLPADEFTVTFLNYDGTVLKEETVKKGKSATAPAIPDREGYSFEGWSVDFSEITEDLFVTAQYTVNQYTVSFVASGVTVATLTKNYGATLTSSEYPAVPAKVGYSGAWKTYDGVITGNVVIEAVYTKNASPETPVISTPQAPATSELDWGQVAAEVTDKVNEPNVAGMANANIDIVSKANIEVPVSLLNIVKGENKTLAFHNGSGVALSISGRDLTRVDLTDLQSINLTVTCDTENIPADTVDAKAEHALKTRTMTIGNTEEMGVPVNMHVNAGKEYAEKYANLYRYNSESGQLEYCGTYLINRDGQAMFAVREGGEYLLTVTEEKPAETVVYTGAQYVVQSGDTLSKIAKRNNLSLEALLRKNPQITNPNRIRPGQKINVR